MKKSNVYIVVLSGQGDIYYSVITEKQYKDWPDETDAMSYLDSLSGNGTYNGDITFPSLKKLFKYISKNNLNIVDDVFGYIY
tara:strand:- start:401 stop:646 length:246 start_codon:yes stop_codon:yes gene_type:complete